MMNEKEQVYLILKPLETDDFQDRNGDYPESGIPTEMYVNKEEVTYAFKNTSKETAKHWIIKYLNKLHLDVEDTNVHVWQSGDYEDDWVDASVSLQNITIISH